MFISLSKTLARFGGFRLGVGMRITKKNALWMSFIVMFVCMIKATWYMMILCGWIIYAMFYGIIWCVKKSVNAFTSKKQYSTSTINENYSDNTKENNKE